ncbi:hypothetical protein ONZ43_g5643 [Nemania bipapillata]|uniref:Uncharacterized protein n=1 Tax=Nemania bipapillata TaxID=110536 RepID=A0ACC2I873_9PEZI|nr:hypothetical protein ONZ43_g5643 [Nemania bipapillata]
MFGTLVSADMDPGRLEFVENPDPVAAVSRNLQDKIRIACISCRSRKVWLRPIFSSSALLWGTEKLREMCSVGDRVRLSELSGAEQAEEAQQTPLGISSNFTAESTSTIATPSHLLEPQGTDLTWASLFSPIATETAVDLGLWEPPHTGHGDVAWTMDADGQRIVGSTSEPLSLPLPLPGKMSAGPEGCCCLLRSVSFLEKLTSRTASRESRLDLLLADVRSSIETLAKLVACDRCAARVEHNMLLAMAAREISIICGKMANCYKAMHLRGVGNTNPSRQGSGLGASSGPVDVLVLTYRVNQRERLHLLAALVTLQILEFRQHIDKIKCRSRGRPNQGQTGEALIEAESHIKLAQVAISSHLLENRDSTTVASSSKT